MKNESDKTKCTWSSKTQRWTIKNLTTMQFEVLNQVLYSMRNNCNWVAAKGQWVAAGDEFTTFTDEEMDALQSIVL